MEVEALSGELAKQCTQAFSVSTGLGCMLSDRTGALLAQHGYSCERCALCEVGGVERQRCVEAHIYSMNQAERFGGKYIYYCPMGLTCFVSPIVGEEGIRGKITVGPFTMVEKEEFWEIDLKEKAGLTAKALEEARRILEQIPFVEPQRVTQLSQLLFFTVSFLNDFSAESRMLAADRSEELQGQITSYILELKQEKEPPPYPFETERALLESVARQDSEEAQRLLSRLLGAILFSCGRDLELLKSRIAEVLTLISRTAVDHGADPQHTLRLSHEYRRTLTGFSTVESLCSWLSEAVARYMQSLFRFSGAKHAKVILFCTQYIGENYSRKITLEGLANMVYLSPAYLSRVFKQETGMNFNQYLNRVRIQKAQELLRVREIRMTDISLLVGFEDQSYFTRVFRRVTGMLPRVYRERMTWGAAPPPGKEKGPKPVKMTK